MSEFLKYLKKDQKTIESFWSWFDNLPKQKKEYFWNHIDHHAAEETFLFQQYYRNKK